MMSFGANLVKARSHLVIIAGLITASALIASIEANDPGTLTLRALGSPALDGPSRRAGAWVWAQIPEDQRSPELRQMAARIGAEGNAPAALSPEEAKALLRVLAQQDATARAHQRPHPKGAPKAP